MTDDAPPTIQERYARASQSTRLVIPKLYERRLGDVDVLIAAGWAQDGLSTGLYRLRAEFDLISRLEIDQAANDETARLLILMRLKSLASTREAVGRFARQLAETRLPGTAPKDVNALVAKVLDVFLSPLCGPCKGRGFTGGYGVPQVWCTRCARSGRRQVSFGKSDLERLFCAELLATLERKLAALDAKMVRYLRNNSEDRG